MGTGDAFWRLTRQKFPNRTGMQPPFDSRTMPVCRLAATVRVHGKRAITADTALRLARYFGTTDRFSMNLQARYAGCTAREAGGD